MECLRNAVFHCCKDNVFLAFIKNGRETIFYIFADYYIMV